MRIQYAYLKQQTRLYRRDYTKALQTVLGHASLFFSATHLVSITVWRAGSKTLKARHVTGRLALRLIAGFRATLFCLSRQCPDRKCSEASPGMLNPCRLYLIQK
ncbi:hypothetical protein SAMN05421850_1151 [Lutimaribacter saemankumensis]|uniref:Uncharacterized protein n=1 Tax=Lutimaribacter saemankumensis TaxID=490829 RepID=A0A1G8SZ60_9RHOB|nr:hypothetical protein SAMN05421850_1151 [Lutimaribacter saemankumensis]